MIVREPPRRKRAKSGNAVRSTRGTEAQSHRGTRLVRAVLLVTAAWAGRLEGQVQAVRFGALVDGAGRVVRDAVVVIDADTIVRVGTGDAAVPRGATVHDLRRYTGIPGLIDVHTHITYWRARGNLAPAPAPGPRTAEQILAGAAENARRTLETGVTTVRDLGASNYTDLAVRDSIALGRMTGPRVFAAGFGLSKQAAAGRAGAPPGPPRGRVRDTSEITQAVRAQAAAGADWIKMYGSTGSFADVTGRQTFTFDEMRAAVNAARQVGKPIAIHSYGPEGARDAMRAGANSVEHATDVPDSVLTAWARSGTFYVPTIDHNRFYADNAAELRYTEEQVAALKAFIARNVETARRAHRAGVKLAMGSDAVYWMFGENTRELRWFVEAGLTPAQALATATTNAAELLGLPNKLGKVAPGFYADLVAVEGDPLADINVVTDRVRWVMRGGRVVVNGLK